MTYHELYMTAKSKYKDNLKMFNKVMRELREKFLGEITNRFVKYENVKHFKMK